MVGLTYFYTLEEFQFTLERGVTKGELVALFCSKGVFPEN